MPKLCKKKIHYFRTAEGRNLYAAIPYKKHGTDTLFVSYRRHNGATEKRLQGWQGGYADFTFDGFAIRLYEKTYNRVPLPEGVIPCPRPQ